MSKQVDAGQSTCESTLWITFWLDIHPVLRGGYLVFLVSFLVFLWLTYTTPYKKWHQPEIIAIKNDLSQGLVLGFGMLFLGYLLQTKNEKAKGRFKKS